MSNDHADWGTVSLREYIEAEIEGLEEKIELLLNERDKAVGLQFTETQRRLFELNGEAGRLRSIQETYWPRENAETYVKEASAREEKVLQRVEETRLALAKSVEDVRQTLEKATSETTRRLEDQIKAVTTERKADSNVTYERWLSIAALVISVTAALIAAL